MTSLSDRKLWMTGSWLTGFNGFTMFRRIVSFLLCWKSCSEALWQDWLDQGSNVWPSTDRMCCLTSDPRTHADPLAAAAEGDYGSGWQMNSRLVWSKDQASSERCFKSTATYLFHMSDYGRSMRTKWKQTAVVWTPDHVYSCATSPRTKSIYRFKLCFRFQMFEAADIWKFTTTNCPILVTCFVFFIRIA